MEMIDIKKILKEDIVKVPIGIVPVMTNCELIMLRYTDNVMRLIELGTIILFIGVFGIACVLLIDIIKACHIKKLEDSEANVKKYNRYKSLYNVAFSISAVIYVFIAFKLTFLYNNASEDISYELYICLMVIAIIVTYISSRIYYYVRGEISRDEKDYIQINKVLVIEILFCILAAFYFAVVEYQIGCKVDLIPWNYEIRRYQIISLIGLFLSITCFASVLTGGENQKSQCTDNKKDTFGMCNHCYSLLDYIHTKMVSVLLIIYK